MCVSICRWMHFNPRSPHGERPNGLRARRAKLDFNPRSPHGERHCKAPRLSPRGTFQSTLPARGATPRRVAGNRIVSISIHAPRTGSDARTSAAIPDVPISIHAPRTGSDTTADRWFAFFPAFQSTLPARGATCSGCSRPIQPEISIHAPRTGSDTDALSPLPSPCISIHAPRTGSDLACPVLLADPAISIHAPRTGSDAPATAHCRWHPAFQSTLPARGATVFSAAMWSASPNFNPRSPHGERLFPSRNGRR